MPYPGQSLWQRSQPVRSFGSLSKDELRLNQDATRKICQPSSPRGDSQPYFGHLSVELAAVFVTGAGYLGPTSLAELDGSVVSLYESA